jgi:predicted nuclease with TOPRIM domain
MSETQVNSQKSDIQAQINGICDELLAENTRLHQELTLQQIIINTHQMTIHRLEAENAALKLEQKRARQDEITNKLIKFWTS